MARVPSYFQQPLSPRPRAATPPRPPAAVYTCLQADGLCNRSPEFARKYCETGCPSTDCLAIAGMAGHPLLQRSCALLARAQPACSNLGMNAAGLRQLRAFYKVRPWGPGTRIPLNQEGLARDSYLVHAICREQFTRHLHRCALPHLFTVQLNLCMAPPGLSSSQPQPPPPQPRQGVRAP